MDENVVKTWFCHDQSASPETQVLAMCQAAENSLLQSPFPGSGGRNSLCPRVLLDLLEANLREQPQASRSGDCVDFLFRHCWQCFQQAVGWCWELRVTCWWSSKHWFWTAQLLYLIVFRGSNKLCTYHCGTDRSPPLCHQMKGRQPLKPVRQNPIISD